MARIVQAPGRKGSQKWLQRMVAEAPERLQPPGLAPLRWLSPLEADGYAEYRDADFLARLGLAHLGDDLARFWPRGGPVWDGLALAGDAVVLVEAKSHLGEARSSPCAARSAVSRAAIAQALALVQADLIADPDARAKADWMRHFYQYANRLAHLWWLHRQGIAAHLLLVGFVGDAQMRGPTRAADWQGLYAQADALLGLGAAHPLSAHVHHLHPDLRLQLSAQSATSRSMASRDFGP